MTEKKISDLRFCVTHDEARQLFEKGILSVEKPKPKALELVFHQLVNEKIEFLNEDKYDGEKISAMVWDVGRQAMTTEEKTILQLEKQLVNPLMTDEKKAKLVLVISMLRDAGA